MVNLDELERLAKAATPGPWIRYDDIHIKNTIGWGIGFLYHPFRSREESGNNVAYSVAACNAVPELIKRVRELERQRDWLAKEIVAERVRTTTSKCLYSYPEDWIKAAEEAAKEAGNERF